jgi:hypothetical protein
MDARRCRANCMPTHQGVLRVLKAGCRSAIEFNGAGAVSGLPRMPP